MIFVSVGTQLGFDRLIRAVDEWAGKNNASALMQIGEGLYEPQHSRWVRTLTASEYDEALEQSELLVSHAGMGSVISAMRWRKPLLVMPRRAELGEHRNDHQLDATGKFLPGLGVTVAMDVEQLREHLDRRSSLQPVGRSNRHVSEDLIQRLRHIVKGATHARQLA